MDQNELAYYVALHFTSGIGSRRLLALCQYFGSPERAFTASAHELLDVPGFGKGVTDAFVLDRASAFEDAQKQLAKLSDGMSIVTYYDEGYPELLKATYSPPPLLFVRGNAERLRDEKMIAVVGSRKTSDYGRRAAQEFSQGFVNENVTVVSGFAKGIDSAAHIAAFEAGGNTIAVLGSGVDIIYPATNKNFANEIVASGRGIIISELPLGTSPEARNFPWRNRIVSGMCRATVIIESEVQGGSMITASLALDENRDVFAVPGDIDRPSSTGPNHLIRESRAKLAVSADQILSELGWTDRPGMVKRSQPISRANLNLFEIKIVDVLESAGGPLQIDELAERAGLEVQDILVQLLTLEFKSVVRQMAGKQFMLVR
jgi:DNA processing protein